MKLCLSCPFLFAMLVLGSSTPLPEECKPLVTPLSLEDPSVMYGKVHFLVGYTDHDLYKRMLKITDSSWMTVSASPSTSNEVIMSQENKMNGTCTSYTTNVTIEHDLLKAAYANMTSSFHLLPSCDGCLVFNINSTAKNIKRLLQLMKLDMDVEDVITAQSLYLLGKETTLKDSELEHFKQQASCLGFSGDPDFQYNPEKTFCAEGEGIKLRI